MEKSSSIFLIDRSGKILKIEKDDFNIVSEISEDNILNFISDDVKLKFLSLLVSANLGTIELSWDIYLKFPQDANFLTIVLKVYDNYLDKYYIAFFKDVKNFNVIINELLSFNNEQINNLRKFLKEHSPEKSLSFTNHSNVEQGYEKLFQELTRINNELIDARRELIKKTLELEEMNRKLEELALKDPLTNLYNRRFFNEIFSMEIGKVKRYGLTLSLVFIDLNNFKAVNDNFGHKEGDKLLVHFANTCIENTRKNVDYLFRFGGDEFLFLLIGADKYEASNVVERINEKIKESTNNLVSLAYGIVEINQDNVDTVTAESILIMLDNLMYAHKMQTKNSIR